ARDALPVLVQYARVLAHDAHRAARDAWPASALAPTDKRVLRDLEAAAKAGGTGELRTILPAWIVARHARRR
ncbi:MAG: hypothetical protein ACK4ST_00580, partial [Elioraea tepidiphila]